MAKTPEKIENNSQNPIEKLEKENRALKELLVEALKKTKNLEKRLANMNNPTMATIRHGL